MWRMISRAVRMAALLGSCLACLALLSACQVQIGQAQQVKPGDGITVHVQVLTDPSGGVTVLVPVVINGQGPYTFVVDTGAAVTLIDTTIADKLGLEVTGDPGQIQGIGGSQTGTPVQVNHWSSGKINLPNTTIEKADYALSEMGMTEVGLLGSDIWDAFGTVTIDYSDQTLTVYRQIASISPAPAIFSSVYPV